MSPPSEASQLFSKPAKIRILAGLLITLIVILLASSAAGFSVNQKEQQQQSQDHKVTDNESKSNNDPLDSKSSSNTSTSDLRQQNLAAAPANEQWDEIVFKEYDLMEYLQNLKAKYKNVQHNHLSPGDELQPISESQDSNSSLEPRLDKVVEEVKRLVVSQSSLDAKIASSTQATPTTTKTTPKAATALPDVPATSLASEPLADHEMGESSWQYGIFDRFTRARSTTTTPDPKYTLDPHAKIDMRQFNSDECGLRTYDQRDQLGDRQIFGPEGSSFYPPLPGAIASMVAEDSLQDQGAIKELNHRRQRPSSFLVNNGGGELSIADLTRWKQMEIIYNNNRKNMVASGNKFGPDQQDQYLASASSQSSSNAAGASSSSENKQIADWPNKDEKDNYDYYKRQMAEQQQQQQSSSSSSLSKDDEFNLLARRNWLQQQLGNTLQMFTSINSTSMDSLLLNSTNKAGSQSGDLATGRENMMKKFAVNNLRAAKNSFAAQPTGGAAVNNNNLNNNNEEPQEIRSISELKARQDELKLEPRVIGGNDARLGDSPWSVSLQALVSRPGTGQVEYRHYCGGTIISEHYILTAAHCLDFMVGRESRLFVVVGDLNWRMSTASQYGRRFGIEKLIIHSAYKNTAFSHDIGLIRTKERMVPLKVNGRYIINSVCLPEKGVEHTGEAELVGWGLFSNRNEMADALQIADVPILPRPLCVDLYRRRTGLIQWLIGIELITEKQVCAGTFGRGICQGDSGSALVFNEKRHLATGDGSSHQHQLPSTSSLTRHRAADDSRATIIGVVAFGGIRRCSYQSLPGVYMQASKYMDWILPRIQNS